MKMKKVYIADEHISSKQNGVGTYMKCLLSCLEDLDVDVNFLSFNSEERFFTVHEEKYCRYYNFPLCNHGKFMETGALCWIILKMYVDDSCDNVFFINHSPCVDFLKNLRKYYRKSRIIFTIHDQGWTAPLLGEKEKLREIKSKRISKAKTHEAEYFCKRYFIEEQKMYRIANDVVCLSSSTKQLLQDTYDVPEEKIHLIPNGMSVQTRKYTRSERNRIREELGIAPQERVLLFVGRTVKAKGIEILLQAFEELCRHHGNLRLVIAGEVFKLNEFSKLVPQSITRITYTGLLPKERLEMWYQAADIGVLPSYTEQCSYTGLEMMANGLLIVTTNGNGLTDMFIPDYNALVASIDSSFPENLERTLHQALLLEDNIREAICGKALDFVYSNYSLQSMKERYRKLLSQESRPD